MRPASPLALCLLPACLLLTRLGAVAQDDEPREPIRTEIVFLSPTAGEPLFDQIEVVLEVRGTNDDAGRVERVELRFDGALVGSRTEPPWRFRLDVGPSNRDRTLYADAVTAGGGSTRAELFAPRFEADEEIDLGLRQLYVTVTDRREQRVLDLEADDFTVVDDGEVQRLITFEGGDIPFTAVLLVDGSQSMRGQPLEVALRGARRFVTSLRPHDETKIMIFGDRVTATSPWGGSEDGLSDRLEALVGRLEFFGGSAIYDHLYLALLRAETRQGRRVVIVLTDGSDLHSVLRANQVEETARRSQALVYVIRHGRREIRRHHNLVGTRPTAVLSVVRSGPEMRGGLLRLETLVEVTGGRVLDIDGIDQVDGALQEILSELREQYALGYYPTVCAGNGSWHMVDIQVSRSGLEVRSRGTYFDD